MTLGEHLRKLIAHALTRHHLDLVGATLDSGQRFRFDLVFEARGKTYRAQHPQFIFRETTFRIADGADDSDFEVLLPSHEVEHFAAHRIEHHAIDGKVAAGNVLARILAEAYFVGTASVRVSEIASES